MDHIRLQAIREIGFEEGITKVAQHYGVEPRALIKAAEGIEALTPYYTGLGAGLGAVGGGVLGAGAGGLGNMALHYATADPEQRNMWSALGKGALVGGGAGALAGGAGLGYLGNRLGRFVDPIIAGSQNQEEALQALQRYLDEKGFEGF